jgi:hypothetical protein
MAQVDPVEQALASAIAEAAEAHRFDVLPVLVKELEARRLARQAPEIVDLEAERRRREGR